MKESEVCGYHQDGVGWDACSDDFENAPCAVARLKEERESLMSQHDIENNAARETAANKYIIFAVNNSDGPCVLNAMVKHGIDYKTAQGYYKGTREVVFIVNADQFDLVFKYLFWAIQNQESILHLGPVDRTRDARPAVLEYIRITSPPLFLGYFYAVQTAYALRCDAWTESDGQYYVAALHRPEPLAGSEWKAAIDASNASVRASNTRQVAMYGEESVARAHKKAAAHHSTPAFETATQRRASMDMARAREDAEFTGQRYRDRIKEGAWAPYEKRVGGTFNKAGAARTPSGHEF